MPTFTVSIPGGRIGNFLAGAVVASVIGGTAVAITSPDFTYSTTKTGYYSIHPMALASADNVAQYTNIYTTSSLFAVNVGVCHSTGVNLPQGSRITQLAVWYQSPAGSDPTVYLQRTTLADGNTSSLLTSGSIADDSNTRKLAVLPLVGGASVVSNTGFAYGFGICLGSNGTFRGARIAYTYTSAGD